MEISKLFLTVINSGTAKDNCWHLTIEDRKRDKVVRMNGKFMALKPMAKSMCSSVE